MIENIKHRGLKRLHNRNDRSGLRADIVDKAQRFLTLLDEATCIEDVDLPSFGVHPLTGNLRGFHSAIMSRNHRIIFRFEHGHVHDVDLVDYH